MEYALAIADRGFDRAIAENPALKRGVNVYGGKIYHAGVARAFKEKVAEF